MLKLQNCSATTTALQKVGGTKLPRCVIGLNSGLFSALLARIGPHLNKIMKTWVKLSQPKVLQIGLKRNVEHMLRNLKPLSVAWNKIQENSFIADSVDFGRELNEILKRKIGNDQSNVQLFRKSEQRKQDKHYLQLICLQICSTLGSQSNLNN